MEWWHLTFASDGRRPLYPAEGPRRAAVRALARCAGSEALLFNLADDHAHVVLECSRGRAGRLAGALALALRKPAAVPLEPARIRPVEGRSHLENLVAYILRQACHHGLPDHPALWNGSCFLDLVGARAVDGLDLHLAAALPRFRLRDAFRAVGLPEEHLDPAPPDRLRALGAAGLRDAVTAALAADPDLGSRSDDVVRARRTVASLARQAGVPRGEVAWALSVTGRTALRLSHERAEERWLLATQRRVALQDAVARAPLLAGEPGPPPYAGAGDEAK